MELEGCVAQEPDLAALKPIYKELEFFSFLKELGPTEDSHTRDYQTLDIARRSASVPRRRSIPTQPVAVAVRHLAGRTNCR